MLAGNIPGRTGTISQRIAMVIQNGDYMTAGFWVLVVMVIALLILLLINLFAGSTDKMQQRW
jgi:molybdate transport system permease protein